MIALYDPKSKKIMVRGTGPFTVETRVTLAHELTHVLQDQHFDLQKLDKAAAAVEDRLVGRAHAGSSKAMPNASRRSTWPSSRPPTARSTRSSRTRSSGTAGQQLKDIPVVIQTYFGAPYIYGPQVVSILENTGGNQAIDNALTGPAPTTRIYLDPTAVNQVGDTPPPVPARHAGETKLSSETVNDEDFDDLHAVPHAGRPPRRAHRAAAPPTRSRPARRRRTPSPAAPRASGPRLPASIRRARRSSRGFSATGPRRCPTQRLSRRRARSPSVRAMPVSGRSRRAGHDTKCRVARRDAGSAHRDLHHEEPPPRRPRGVRVAGADAETGDPVGAAAPTPAEGQEGMRLGAQAGMACRENTLAGIP